MHRIIVEIGIEYGIARLQLVVAGDQKLQGLGRAARQRDFLGREARDLRHLGTHIGEIGIGLAARVIGVLGVHEGDAAQILLAHRLGHDAPEAVLEIGDLFRDRIEVAP